MYFGALSSIVIFNLLTKIVTVFCVGRSSVGRSVGTRAVVVVMFLFLGASFGEVELLRADGTTAPRLATCRCVGENKGGENKGCEVLVVSGHMFDLLTDVFYGIRMKLVDQVRVSVCLFIPN